MNVPSVTYIEPATPALLEWIIVRSHWRRHWGIPPGLYHLDIVGDDTDDTDDVDIVNETSFVCMRIAR